MRNFIMILLLLAALPVSSQMVYAKEAQSQGMGVLIRDIRMDGFVLPEKNQFVKLFKPYRNKYLTTADMDAILGQLQEIYEQAGYQGLVSIEYQVSKKSLKYTVSLIR